MEKKLERDELKEVFCSYFNMAIQGIIVIGLAKAIAVFCNETSPFSYEWQAGFEYLGYLCWVTALGALGTKILTWSQGETPKEQLDEAIGMALSLIGVFSFVFAKELIIK
jgi:hypothetical protein